MLDEQGARRSEELCQGGIRAQESLRDGATHR